MRRGRHLQIPFLVSDEAHGFWSLIFTNVLFIWWVYKLVPHTFIYPSWVQDDTPHINFNENPPPFSSSSLPENMPLKSVALISGTFPLTGAFGVSLRLRFS